METDHFSAPIPALVRIYGFGVLVLVVLSLIVFSFYFKIKRVTPINLFNDNGRLYAICELNEFQTIKSLDTVKVEMNTGEVFNVVFKLKESVLSNNNIRIPLVVLDKSNWHTVFHNDAEQQAIVIIENTSLLAKIFSERSKI